MADDELDPPALSDEQSQLEKNWADLARWSETCETCDVRATATPAPHGRWVLAVEHADDCAAAG